MEAPQAGNYWKTPFVWEPGCPPPPPASSLRFQPAVDDWLIEATGQAMSDSLDESARHAIRRYGRIRAASRLLESAPDHFEWKPEWWQAALDGEDRRVGFVLPVLFRGERTWRNGQPEGTIFYMGVLSAFRGQGYGLDLLFEATRVLMAARCWRILCDTGTGNHAMVRTFRKAGYKELEPWERPLE